MMWWVCSAWNLQTLPALLCILRAELSTTHRLLSSSFLGLPYRILNMNHKNTELLSSLCVSACTAAVKASKSSRNNLLSIHCDLPCYGTDLTRLVKDTP